LLSKFDTAGAEVYSWEGKIAITGTPEFDDLAVDVFSAHLKEKMAIGRKKGRYGWYKQADERIIGSNNGVTQAELLKALQEHMLKGDPRDVALFCMFLFHHGWSTTLPQN
jgi:hypothetical protein